MKRKEFFELLHDILKDIKDDIVFRIDMSLENLEKDKQDSYRQRRALVEIKDYVRNGITIETYKLEQEYLSYLRKKARMKIKKIEEEAQNQIDNIRRRYGF